MMAYELNPLCSKVYNYSCSLELQAPGISSWHILWKLRVLKPLLRQRELEFGLWAQARVLATGITGQFSKLTSDRHKVEYFVVLCQEGLKALGPKLPTEENVKVPKMPTLKNAFNTNPKDSWEIQMLFGRNNPSTDGHPLTPGLDQFKTLSTGVGPRRLCFGWGLESGSLGYVLSHEAWHGSRIGVSWLPEPTLGQIPLCSLLWAQPSLMQSPYVCRPRGRWCEGVRRRRVIEGETLGGVLWKALPRRRVSERRGMCHVKYEGASSYRQCKAQGLDDFVGLWNTIAAKQLSVL